MALAAVGRLIGPELARGISTALAIFSSSNSCPDCNCAPVFTCPETRACPDCVCQGNQRACPACPTCPSADWTFLALIWITGVLSGVLIVGYLKRERPVAASLTAESLIDQTYTEVPVQAASEPRISAAAKALAKRKAQ